MITVTVCIFIVLVVARFGAQGMFSAFLHLILTVLAGCLALALWEPIVYGMLLARMPEYAWGAGLLLPFGLILLVLRWTFDHYIGGNVNFHAMADRIGGGFFGLLSGILTAGMLVIGLQMIGLQSLFGYQGWTVNDEGEPERVATIFPNVDGITASFFDRLSGGAMSAITGNVTLADVRPRLDIDASLFNQPAFVNGTRRAVVPGAAWIDTKEHPYAVVTDDGETDFKNIPKPSADQKLVIVPVRIAVQTNDVAHGSGDEDGIYRVTRNQIPLAAHDPVSGKKTFYYPEGYIYNREYKSLIGAGEFAYSPSGTISETIHLWVYLIPIKHEPEFVSVKNARLDLPQINTALTETSTAVAMGNYVKPDRDPDPGTTGDPPPQQWRYRVNNKLPWTFNKNRIQGVTFVGNAIANGRGTLRKPDRGRIQKNIAVSTIHHASTARIVQVNLGTRKSAESLLGKVVEKSVLLTQPPLLIDDRGTELRAMGFGVVQGAEYTFSINPAQAMRNLNDINLGSLSDKATVILYFQVPQGSNLVQFKLGQETEELDVKVPKG